VQLLSEDQAVIGVASRDTVEEMEAFVDRHGLADVVNIADPDGVVWDRFGVFGQPTWAFVDGETGEVTVRFGGLGQQGVLAAFADGGF
jgi:peroxiredoxin